MRIIKHAERVECVRYSRDFQWKGSHSGHGFGFQCDEHGKIDLAALKEKPAAFQNYLKCLFNHEEIQDKGTSCHEWSYIEPAEGKCSCGCTVILDSFTNTCDNCGRDYNKSGQELAPRSQWGEETGETLADILDI